MEGTEEGWGAEQEVAKVEAVKVAVVREVEVKALAKMEEELAAAVKEAVKT